MRNEVKKQGWPGTVPGATPNKALQATANSVRSSLAPAVCRA
jgi:hypothetical protein